LCGDTERGTCIPSKAQNKKAAAMAAFTSEIFEIPETA
jgi:hypothetical protein